MVTERTRTIAIIKTTGFLQADSKGADVVKLQIRLKAVGFYPGAFDGDFRPATKASDRQQFISVSHC